MNLAQEAEINLKEYEGLNDDPSGMHISTSPLTDPAMMTIFNKRNQGKVGNKNINVPKLN